MTQQAFHFLALGLLGVVFHSLLKLKSLSDYSRTANLTFNWWNDYVVKDLFSILLSLCSVGVWLLLFKEIAAKYKGLEAFSLTSFFVMGALGSYLLQTLLSRAKKKITKVVDEKTNIADGID